MAGCLRTACAARLLALLLFALPAVAQVQYNYTTNAGKITITKYNGPGGEVTLPDKITGLPVISIGAGAFEGCDNLTSVTIPNSVTTIGDHAFENCGLMSVAIPNSVTYLGEWAFSHCTNLTGILIPDRATRIGQGAFNSCTNLASITIGNSVTSIGDWAFLDCYKLTNVTIPNSVTSIEDDAFDGCSSLISITIPNSVTNIGTSAYFYCTSLAAITVDTLNPFYCSVDGVLFNKSQTTLIQCPGGKIGSYTIPNSVTTIENEAFTLCTNLTSITIPSSVTNIGSPAFDRCTSLAVITVDAQNPFYCSVNGVLFNKSQTTLIQCPGGIIGSYTIPNSVTTIGNEAFTLCRSLTSVQIPNTIMGIGALAFGGCIRLTSVAIPDSVTYIGVRAFSDCRSLASVTIGKNVTRISDYVFSGCTSLIIITIPNSVTNIGNSTFYNCINLTSIYFKGNAPSVSSSSFKGDNNATVYYLAGTTGWGPTFAGRPAVLWNPQVLTSVASFGVWTNRFGFTITGTSNLVIVVEACTDLANPIWSPLQTNTLSGNSFYFSDPQWTNYPGRFYRLRSP